MTSPPPWGGAIFDHMGMIGGIYVELHMTLLHIRKTTFVSCSCRVDFFMYFHNKSMVDNDMPGAWPAWTPGAWLAGFIKRTTIHCYTKNMIALGLVRRYEKIFFKYIFPNAPRVWPVWTPGARLAGFMIFIEEDHYTLLHTNYVSSGPCGFRKDFFSHCRSMGANGPWSGAFFDQRDMVGRIYKVDHYTLLHTKSESSGPCGFREDFFHVFP